LALIPLPAFAQPEHLTKDGSQRGFIVNRRHQDLAKSERTTSFARENSALMTASTSMHQIERIAAAA
jgi:hypothetical protein